MDDYVKISPVILNDMSPLCHLFEIMCCWIHHYSIRFSVARIGLLVCVQLLELLQQFLCSVVVSLKSCLGYLLLQGSYFVFNISLEDDRRNGLPIFNLLDCLANLRRVRPMFWLGFSAPLEEFLQFSPDWCSLQICRNRGSARIGCCEPAELRSRSSNDNILYIVHKLIRNIECHHCEHDTSKGPY